MDDKTKELIAVGASVAVHCQPCLRLHADQAVALGIGRDEIAEAMAVGKRVQKGAMADMRRLADELLDQIPQPGRPRGAAASPREKEIAVFDPAMCCATGVCGPNIDPRLVTFAGALKQIAGRGVAVKRYNLAQQPQAFVESAQVKAHLAELGHENLPFIYIDGELEFYGRYPDPVELLAVLKLDGGQALGSADRPKGDAAGLIMASVPGADEKAGGCCPGGGCC
jgi:AhpD family alkylhydroperoxidase